jgi:competence ComEA-like helix-hairpin-helix protein
MTRFSAFTIGITALTMPIVASLHVITAQSAPAAKAPPNTPLSYNWPDGPGKDIVKKACLSCHNASVIVTPPGRTGDEWADEVGKMIGRGAILSDDDADQVVDYLSNHFGPDFKGVPPAAPGSQDKSAQTDKNAPAASDSSAPLNVNKASAEELQSALRLSRTEADSIVQYREQHGGFKNWQQVASVQGVPADKIERNQKRLVF